MTHKMTHQIIITMRSHAEAAQGIARKAVKLLRNSGLECEERIELLGTTAHKPFAESIHSMHEVLEPLSPEQAEAPLQAPTTIQHFPTIYIMTSGASVFYGPDPFRGKLDAMHRITVSAMHPHYSNPLEVAQELEDTFRSRGIEVIRSVYVEPKA